MERHRPVRFSVSRLTDFDGHLKGIIAECARAVDKTAPELVPLRASGRRLQGICLRKMEIVNSREGEMMSKRGLKWKIIGTGMRDDE